MGVNIAFGFILTMVILGFVLFFGTGVLNDLLGLSGDAGFKQQTADIFRRVCGDENCRGGLYWMPGNTDKFTFSNSGFSEVCFLDYESDLRVSTETWEPSLNVLIIDDVKENEYNIYGIKNREATEKNIGVKIKNLKPNENFCINKNTELILRGKGSYVEIALPE